MAKKTFLFITMGALNLLHGSVHIIQFIQSVALLSYSLDDNVEHTHGSLDFMDSPIVSLIWVIVGVITLVIGIRDYIHHKKCKD